MANLNQYKKEWYQLIAKDEMFKLFKELAASLDPNSDVFTELILQNGRYQTNHNKEMKGIISHDNATLEHNRVKDAMSSFIQQLSQEDIGQGGSLEDPFDQLLADMKIKHPLTPLYLVNCDRRKNNRRFNRAFRQWEGLQRRYQYYFVLGCSSQEPEGFAERMVFEIIDKRIENHSDSINYPRAGAGERIAIPSLPTGFTLEDAKDGFKKILAERFLWGNDSFQTFIETTLPARKEKYIVFPFSILASDWDDPDTMEEYFEWIIETFSNENRKGPICLFIFIVWLKNAHIPEKIKYEREVFDSVKEIVEEHQEKIAFLYPFEAVPRYYLEEWLEKIADISQNEKNTIIDTFCQRLNPEEQQRYESEDQLLDMERIEELQEKIWTIHRTK